MQCSTVSSKLITGGYTPLTPIVLCNLLSALDTDRITFRAARTYVASILIKTIRDAAFASDNRKEKLAQYQLSELHKRVGGVGGEYIREDLNLLQGAGLLTFSSTEVTLANVPIPEAKELLAEIAGGRHRARTIPVPRRVFEYLCRITQPSLFKTALAYLLRGLSLKRDGTINPNGSAKASWIAQVTGISLRAAKAARQTLTSIGWLSADQTSSQWKLNRTGAYFSINLSWEAPKECDAHSSASSSGNQTMTESAPHLTLSTGESAPLCRDIKLPNGNKETRRTSKNRAPSGLSKERVQIPKPCITAVVEKDLHELPRALALYEDAVQKGVLEASEANLLNWLAAAVRARTAKARDPVRVFLGLVKKKLWHHITHEEEERARQALKRHREKGEGFSPPSNVTDGLKRLQANDLLQLLPVNASHRTTSTCLRERNLQNSGTKSSLV